MPLLSNLMPDPHEEESRDRVLVKIFKRVGFHTDGPLLRFFHISSDPW